MAKFLFVIPPLMGHINPTLSIGQKLLEKGHSVAWTGFIKLPDVVIPKGGIFFILNSPHIDDLRESVKTKNTFSGLESIQFVFKDFFIPLAKYMFPEVLKVIDAYKPDIIINDLQTFAGAIAAYVKGIPNVSSVTNAPATGDTIIDMPKVVEWEEKQIIELQKELGINREKNISFSKQLCLVYSTTTFVGSSDFPDYFKFIGPVINRPGEIDFNWEKLHQSAFPKVLVSMGTTDRGNRKYFFEKIISAFANEPLTIVCVAETDLVTEWPDNFIVQSYLPQLNLMKELNAVICHGGHNTVCEAISNDLPIVVIPMAYDQYRVASQIVNSGCGIRLKFNRLKAEHLSKSLFEILTEDKYRNAVKSIKESFINAGGTERAVELLEEFRNKFN